MNRKVKTVEDKAGIKKKMLLKQQGQIFGAYSFFTGNERLIDVQCKEFTTIIKINRQKFVDIVKENKKDYERFCEIKDKMIFSRYVDEIPDQQCMICNAKDHLFDRCHFGHFDKNNVLLFFKYNYSNFQERKSQQRKDQKLKSLAINSKLCKDIIDFRCDRGIEFYSSENENSDYGSGDQTDQHSEQSDIHNKMKKSKNQSKYYLDDDSRLVYSSLHQQSPLQTKYYPASDFDIIRSTPDDEANKMKTLSQKHTIEDCDKIMLQEEINTPIRSPSPQRKQSSSRQQLKSKKSLVKFDSQVGVHINNNQNSGGVQGNNQNNNVIRYEQNTNSLANRRKLSNLNITSPKLGSEFENKQEQVITKKNYNHQGTGHSYQTYGTNHSLGNNQSLQNINSHQNINVHGSIHHSHHHQQYHIEKSHKQIMFQEKEIQLDQAQSLFTKLSNQKGPTTTNQLNYRKTITMLPQSMFDEHNFIWGFDKQKDFQFYFPYFNSQNVIRRVNNYLNKIQKLKKLKSGGKRYTEIGTQKKKKLYSMTNLNSKISSVSRINTQNIKNPQKSNNNNEFSLNLVQIDAIKGDKTGTNKANKNDKILNDFLKKQGDN